MKKISLFFTLFGLLTIVSCSSDDGTPTNEVNPTPNVVEWIPKQIIVEAINYQLDYPHAQGCPNDYIRIVNNNSAILFEHEQGTCEITETEQAWNRNGNQISLTLFDTNITGTVVTENNTEMIVQVPMNQISGLITLLYPEVADYIGLLANTNVKIVLLKK